MNRFLLAACFVTCTIGCQSTSHPGSGTVWKDSFTVDRSHLLAQGKSPYFDLTPGVVHQYREDDTILTITVLNETRTIDGITTRIIEEREVEAGKPKEISRNFFAIDPSCGDVYYFGEEVDVYDARGNVTHPGVWRSGAHGARFGLMIPGHPKVGDKFYQELAPDVAMDRFEIISADEVVETPAGRFEHCVHALETTPLEPGTGHKWYAPGVGLVKDGNAVLISRAGR